MKLCEDLRQAVLQAAIQGKLTKQRLEDGDARDLLKQIAEEKAQLIKDKKIKKEKPLPEITEEDIPFDIPENWVWTRLGEITVFENGDRSTSYPNDNDITSSGVPFFGAKDMVNGIMSLRGVRFISQDKFDKLRGGKLIDGDLVCLLRGSVGKIALFNSTSGYKTGFICAQMLIIRLIFKSSIAYVNMALKSGLLIGQINSKVTGTAVRQLPAQDLRTVILPLPPLAEQHRIVAKVDTLMAEIDELEKIENELTALKDAFPGDMKSALLQAAMQGKLTDQRKEDGNASDLLKQIAEDKAKLIKAGKLKKEKPLAEISEDEIPFEIPDNWHWVRLGNVGSFIRGSGIKKDDVTDKGMPCVRYGQLYTTYKIKFSRAVSYTSEIVFNNCKKANNGDILMALTGENEYDIATAVLYEGNDELAIGGDMTKFTPIMIHPMYLVTVINSSWGVASKSMLASGNIIVHISNDKLASILVPIPPLAEQERIVAKLDKLLPLCDTLT